MNLHEIKTIREAKGYSQRELAKKAKVTQCQLSKIENGLTDPTFTTLMRVLKALGAKIAIV